jgi:hypothetical protein
MYFNIVNFNKNLTQNRGSNAKQRSDRGDRWMKICVCAKYFSKFEWKMLESPKN